MLKHLSHYYKTKQLIAFVLFTVGIFVFSIGFQNTASQNIVTEAVVRVNLPDNFPLATTSLLGIFFILGAFITLAFTLVSSFEEARKIIKKSIDEVVKKCEKGIITPKDAAEQINKAMGGIHYVKFKPDDEHTVYGSRYAFPVHLTHGETAIALAIMEYKKAVSNHPEEAAKSEVHIAPNVSTKHHTRGFEDLLNYYDIKYSKK